MSAPTTTVVSAALTLSRQLGTGLVRVNASTGGGDFHAPFGGEKPSGYGPREQGNVARDFYTRLQTVTKGSTPAAALGPALVPVVDAPPLAELRILLTVRRDGAELYSNAVPLSGRRRRPEELLGWLFAAMDFPVGVVRLSGTSIVPPADFTLQPGDEVEVDVPEIGTRRNPVRRVGRPAPVGSEAAP
jgi:hypothetical protein